ncbi:hypothetical protein Malapachy_1001 [Malassezia pachydermatis]|uniref:Uncharacterized protein n=1 Tax=Malassezia pachydermatis TaxID=77020 RepID=A0A0M8MQB2_9BASI|nr:hypothetical protein Malapachy_1001 [Malassezia pachydermatis]KOS14687.1 hypothetical protein Malapachy_1001 [Malassezia pachydermatis]
MVKLSTPLALLAVAVAGAMAQAPAPASSAAAAPASSAAAPASSAAPAPDSSAAPAPQPSSAPAAGQQGGDNKNGGAQTIGDTSTAVCSALFGDPKVHPYDCKAPKTVVPPYNLSSLVSYFVGGYEHKRGDAAMVSEVADDLADSVLHYYPTVTQSKEYIVYAMYQGILSSIHEDDPKFAPVDKIKPPPGVPAGAAERYALPGAMAVAAAVVGGAVLL